MKRLKIIILLTIALSLLLPTSAIATPEPQNLVGKFARVRHDCDYMDCENWRFDLPDSRPGFSGNSYPSPVPMFPAPKGGDAAFRYDEFNWKHLQGINSAASWYLIRRNNAGYFNANINKDWPAGSTIPQYPTPYPKAESVNSIGNLVRIVGVESGSAVIDCIDINSTTRYNYFTYPWLYVKFTSINDRGQVGLVEGTDIYYPILCSDKIFIPLEKLEIFPSLPVKISVTSYKLNHRKAPTIKSPVIGVFNYGDSFTITEYHFWGSDVWAKTDQGGWVSVNWTSRGGTTYFTSWRMDNASPRAQWPKIHEAYNGSEAPFPTVQPTVTPTPTPIATAVPTIQPTPEPTKAWTWPLSYFRFVRQDGSKMAKCHPATLKKNGKLDAAENWYSYPKSIIDGDILIKLGYPTTVKGKTPIAVAKFFSAGGTYYTYWYVYDLRSGVACFVDVTDRGNFFQLATGRVYP